MIPIGLSGLSDYVNEYGKKSCRRLAELFGTSKSSINRRQKKIENRADRPAAAFFESQEGRQWCLRFVIASIFVFGIINGVGAKRISLFFSLIKIDSFVAVSTSSVFRIENQIEALIIKYREKADLEIMDKASELEITPGADETYFDNLMLLVLMDLNSGFIFVEEPAVKRDHKTWESCSLSLLSTFKMVRCFVSDKARALLKLAKDSFMVDRIPDLFHMMNDVSSVMKFSFHRLIKGTEKSIANIQKDIKKGVNVAINKDLSTKLQAKIATITMSRDSYRRHLRALSVTLHPFSILSSNPQSSSVVETNMLASLSKVKAIKTNLEISDSQKKLDRVERQIPDAAKQIDLWWGWVKTSLESVDMTPELKDWLLLYLLPYIYWSNQLKKTRSKTIKRFYSWSIRKAELKLMAHSLTERMMPSDRKKESEWVIWAKNMTQLFQRTTSPVEGRNGWLSQMYFNGRGLSVKRIKSQTAIHNYFLKREDGTTACERLTGEKPGDLFEFIMGNIGPLPEPRKRKSTNQEKPLILRDVPA